MTDYEKLKRIIEDAERIIQNNTGSYGPEFEAWDMRTMRFLRSYFGEDSLEFKSYDNTSFCGISFNKNEDIEICNNALRTTIAIFETYLEEIESESDNKKSPKLDEKGLDCSKIFIVHGHDGELKQSIARLIEQQGIEAIILSEQVNQGRTIIEKFEDYSEVSGAICLFTADDFGRAKNDVEDSLRARQNVVFEAGYFIGKLGRSNVILISDKDVEMPSDLSGVVYTNKGNWKLETIKELKALGYNVDANKLI